MQRGGGRGLPGRRTDVGVPAAGVWGKLPPGKWGRERPKGHSGPGLLCWRLASPEGTQWMLIQCAPRSGLPPQPQPLSLPSDEGIYTKLRTSVSSGKHTVYLPSDGDGSRANPCKRMSVFMSV